MEATTKSPDQRAFRDVIPLAVWTVVWLASLALARFGPNVWGDQPVLSWIAVGLNLAIGVGWIVIHARYLGRVDDLQRKILVDGMALALGVGLVGGFAFAAADSAGLLGFEANVAFVTALMGVVYAIGSVVGTLRYR
jgi:hypothetical protein